MACTATPAAVGTSVSSAGQGSETIAQFVMDAPLRAERVTMGSGVFKFTRLSF